MQNESQDQSQNESESHALTFSGTFYRATTTIDGGIRLSFDLPAHFAPVIVDLIKHQRDTLQIAIVPHPRDEDYFE